MYRVFSSQCFAQISNSQIHVLFQCPNILQNPPDVAPSSIHSLGSADRYSFNRASVNTSKAPPNRRKSGSLPRNSSKNTCRERSGCPLGKLIPPFSHGGFQNSTPSVRNASSWSKIPNLRPFEIGRASCRERV